ncbi:hypothetical protein KC318_g745 [Hortaea werneckii]|uniref:Vacuolar ATPase assembly protein VMA22 n=1 Tax=Hortaea werneckii TaxID=91943 RepID=A0A3M6ZZA1_HORWE|nr:hypothetical protein KC334_g4928 [Hortaea werneckii]KAI7023648.1 hypothetical protein KC355_g1651 [Hortaea werneckii]KAI7675748.1 hypothetical protein KC318_g745 [Hortaea werneckii]RMY20634.1 hypothetical protein D0867_03870 [Hortaea werneckii]RMY26249.1 hypothetical protein D0866_10900 [Hortaea werneckii]
MPTETESTPTLGENRQLTAGLAEVNDRLDDLWVKYLDCLDQYQRAQESVQKALSSGFFSLAQANFKSSAGRRYGQDFYDERMKASKRVQIVENGNDRVLAISMNPAVAPGESSEGPKQKTEASQQPSPPSTPVADDEDAKTAEKPKEPTTLDDKKDQDSEASGVAHQPATRSPLTWFGILTPRELRSAQQSFSTAISSPTESAVNATREMRQLEAEINRTRKAVRKAEKGGPA